MVKGNIIDLFCGVGGLSLGFEKTGYKSLIGIDLWKDAIDTYNYNRTDKTGIVKAVSDFSDKELLEFKKQDVNGIIGGPPCQGFSMVGTRKKGDSRNSLYLEFVRYVDLIKPEFFILENVKGLLSMSSGYFKVDIIDRFSNIGYNVNYEVLKASDYGLAQNRERVFFIGLLKEKYKNTFFEFPEKTNVKLSTKEAIGDLPVLEKNNLNEKYRSNPNNAYQSLMRENINSDIPKNHDYTNHTDQTINIISMVPDGGSIKDLPEKYYKIRNYNTAFKRMNSKEPSITIDCGHRNYFHYSQNRVPTVREVARLQSFSDDFIFQGSKTSQYTQVGNAVPPLLAKIIAKKIEEINDSL